MSCCCFTSYNLKHLENIKKYINRATEYLTQENQTQENQTQENQTQEEDEYDIIN